MRMKHAAILLVVIASCGRLKTVPLRPLATGTFDRYKIEPCTTAGGHVVKLTAEPDERGEHRSRERIEKYREQYLMPALKPALDVKGWSFDSTCGRSGLTLRVAPAAGVGEALHRVGETLSKNPTDIEVTVVGAK